MSKKKASFQLSIGKLRLIPTTKKDDPPKKASSDSSEISHIREELIPTLLSELQQACQRLRRLNDCPPHPQECKDCPLRTRSKNR